MNISIIIFIGVGGFIGAVSRFLISGWVQKSFESSFFPFGTLSVNVIGSFIIGAAVVYFEQVVSPEYKALIITGFLGALTTFSTFSFETVTMLQDGDYTKAFANILFNVLFCVTATILGMLLFKKLYF